MSDGIFSAETLHLIDAAARLERLARANASMRDFAAGLAPRVRRPTPILRRFAGLEITVENPAGSVRQGVDRDGRPWATRMLHDYGCIARALGADREELDVYLGPSEGASHVYVVHQNDPATGRYDEDKCMIGWASPEAAKAAYLAQYDRPEFFGSITAVPAARFVRDVEAADGGVVRWKRKGRGR